MRLYLTERKKREIRKIVLIGLVWTMISHPLISSSHSFWKDGNDDDEEEEPPKGLYDLTRFFCVSGRSLVGDNFTVKISRSTWDHSFSHFMITGLTLTIGKRMSYSLIVKNDLPFIILPATHFHICFSLSIYIF